MAEGGPADQDDAKSAARRRRRERTGATTSRHLAETNRPRTTADDSQTDQKVKPLQPSVQRPTQWKVEPHQPKVEPQQPAAAQR